ncbi:MAG: GNAT family N-acetyltransferase [Bacteroidia bacterium]|nr:GNAT family N-acetyltransferase [Bacteroidia bacterium]
MAFREAGTQDIPRMHSVRLSVRENILSNPDLVTTADYERLLTTEGKGWLCESDGEIVAFAVVDTVKNNIWALFVHPDFEGRKIGYRLHNLMLNWFYKNSTATLWLSTDSGTRADQFYRKAGWTEVLRFAKNEVKFEMTYADWQENGAQ